MRQIDEVEAQIRQEETRAALEIQRLTDDKAGLAAEYAAVRAEQAFVGDMVMSAQESVAAIEKLLAEGYATKVAARQRREALLTARRQRAALDRQALALKREIEARSMALRQAPVTSAERLSQLNSRKAELSSRRVEIEGRRALTLTAPAGGTVAAVTATAGSTADLNRPAVTLIPNNAELKAMLYVPARSAGFIAPGQPVRLKYDAYPYQRFGLYPGTVERVERTALTPQEAGAPLALNEAVYRVTVALRDQAVLAYGETLPLSPGMSLNADIELDRQSLLRWMLDPLYVLKGQLPTIDDRPSPGRLVAATQSKHDDGARGHQSPPRPRLSLRLNDGER